MTLPPDPTRAADPYRRSGPAHPGGAPQPQSFQYRPHDPYGAFAAGRPSGPVLPPPPTFAQRWGIRGREGRPRQITVILQALWIHLAITALTVLVGLSVALLAFAALSFAGFFTGVLLGLVVAAANAALIWAVAKEELGRFGFQDSRTVFYIGLGLLALNALTGVFSILRILPSLAQLLAVALCLVLLHTRPAKAWLERPGNRPRKAPDQRPDSPIGIDPPPPVWRDAHLDPRPNGPRPPAPR
ncbi:hypothetical protein [Glycomyces sp. NRRL B-16210]|uniref:hypothetical protein n=1 Tax=Glycomyces sp. NRRL B-16210 TaxID=1463821 RepID=UPI0004C19F9D|nr:hypothetical protein [Glycomyces sp. NRRL B-16210]